MERELFVAQELELELELDLALALEQLLVLELWHSEAILADCSSVLWASVAGQGLVSVCVLLDTAFPAPVPLPAAAQGLLSLYFLACLAFSVTTYCPTTLDSLQQAWWVMLESQGPLLVYAALPLLSKHALPPPTVFAAYPTPPFAFAAFSDSPPPIVALGLADPVLAVVA